MAAMDKISALGRWAARHGKDLGEAATEAVGEHGGIAAAGLGGAALGHYAGRKSAEHDEEEHPIRHVLKRLGM